MAKVIDNNETNYYKRWIKEAVHIRKRRGTIMNRDEGSKYYLSRVYDELLLPKDKKRTGNTKTPSSVGGSR